MRNASRRDRTGIQPVRCVKYGKNGHHLSTKGPTARKTPHSRNGRPVPYLLASSRRKKAHRSGLFCGGLLNISGVIRNAWPSVARRGLAVFDTTPRIIARRLARFVALPSAKQVVQQQQAAGRFEENQIVSHHFLLPRLLLWVGLSGPVRYSLPEEWYR